MAKRKSAKRGAAKPAAESYQHPKADVALRPDVGTQAQFRKKKPPATYRYDSSLAPSLEWDGENSARELGEWLLRQIEEAAALALPEVEVCPLAEGKYQVKLLGLDVFDPVTMQSDTRDGSDVPCWLLDTDYNDLCFHVSQTFFPRTGAWENLKRALRGEYDESVWAHLSGTTSAPFEPGENRKIAVKVIDDRGNELLVVREL